MTKLIHSNDMPTPTNQRPWAQVEWLFDQRGALTLSKSSKQNFNTAKGHFLAFIRQQLPVSAAPSPYRVDREFDEYILLRFKQYIDDLMLSSGHRVSLLSCARQTIETAIANNWVDLRHFINFSLGTATRETDARAPYSDAEITSIVSALDAEIRFSRSLLKPYTESGLGRPPNIEPYRHGTRYERSWWRDESNMRWYFENVLDCQPITGSDPAIKKTHASFLQMAAICHGGLHKMYRRWGVSAWIGPEIILPYLYKLVQVTGINPTVAMSLRLDSYQDQHPLTQRAYIRYWKERGSGESDLHVDLLRGEVLALDPDQTRSIRWIWKEVAALTQGFRHELPAHDQDILFIYQSRGVKAPGQSRHFLTDLKTTGHWAREFVSRHDLRNAKGEPLTLTLARFRPSLVSRLVKRGADIGVVQSILGHASIMTTYGYLESHDFNPKARAEVIRAVERIRENRRQQEESPKPVATETYDENNAVFATGLALCKNVFNPPENIRKAGGVGLGKPCTFFNMCLRCPNVLIMEEHLPHLFALRTQYMVAMEQGLSATPHRAAIQQNIHILNQLLNPKTSDWPSSVLVRAQRMSEFIDLGIDPVGIRAVQE